MEELGDEPSDVTIELIKDLTAATLVSIYPHDTYTNAARRHRLLDEISSRQQASRDIAAFTSFFKRGSQVWLGVFVQLKPEEPRYHSDPGRVAGKSGEFILRADGVEQPERSNADSGA